MIIKNNWKKQQNFLTSNVNRIFEKIKFNNII